MESKSRLIFISILSLILQPVLAQETICLSPTQSHKIDSEFLKETREYWVALPLNYSDSISYPVIFVLDAEWRFELVRQIAFDLGGHHKIDRSIIVGIPHIEVEKKRGQDLTFSHSKIEFDGDIVDWYDDSNSGGAEKFYDFLTKELIPDLSNNYPINNHHTLIGHSYGGYFGAYILDRQHPFEILHLYDPSIWYSDGEVTRKLKSNPSIKPVKIHLTYQGKPAFHREKIEEFIQELEKQKESISLSVEFYELENHFSIFLDSFYKGIQLTNHPEKK
ncbi:alpha/beta hydrolase [Algoriphagus limi]|uniref:Alpha/beta hydrolase-fold protein n=1 Tax=Algoriphagus limi TaxID=2975273 RepID=A0ABT2G3K9_9BACT|nr:alpha/beta hydrolase-fold protein [Algoriphagus limi]MCS5489853.1 alpha/beta hydrolase-fold protein [Algoriphagus limi]